MSGCTCTIDNPVRDCPQHGRNPLAELRQKLGDAYTDRDALRDELERKVRNLTAYVEKVRGERERALDRYDGMRDELKRTTTELEQQGRLLRDVRGTLEVSWERVESLEAVLDYLLAGDVGTAIAKAAERR